jgi:hypothetical protein
MEAMGSACRGDVNAANVTGLALMQQLLQVLAANASELSSAKRFDYCPSPRT